MNDNKLSTKEILALKAQAHHLHPVVMVGQQGLTDSVIKETDAALTAHELIKVRVFGDDMLNVLKFVMPCVKHWALNWCNILANYLFCGVKNRTTNNLN